MGSRQAWRFIVLAASALFTTGALAAQSESRPRPRVSVPPAAEREIQSALEAYAGGDDLAPGRWAKSLKDSANVAYLEPVVLKSGSWSRSNAAFMLEVALNFPVQGRTLALLNAGRSVVMSRPLPLGVDPVEDRFEVLWHQIALGLLQPSLLFFAQQDYLDAVVPRFDDARERGVALVSRLPLARAIAAGVLCCLKSRPGEPARPIEGLSRGLTLDKALSLFGQAADVPVLRYEALVRGARLLFEAARYAEAETWLSRVTGPTDALLGYVHHLTHGRVLDALNRPADAVTAYRSALSFVPGGQLAGIGLAAALLRAGRVEEAETAAIEARRMPTGLAGRDPVHIFALGDARFLPAWLIELRRLRR